MLSPPEPTRWPDVEPGQIKVLVEGESNGQAVEKDLGW
jgi:hypothetical protein